MDEYQKNLKTYYMTSIDGNLDVWDKLPIFLKVTKPK